MRGQTGSVERYGVAIRGASTSVTLTLKYDIISKVRAFQLSKLHNLTYEKCWAFVGKQTAN